MGKSRDKGYNNGSMTLLYISALSMGIAYGAHVPLVPVFAREILDATYVEVGMIGMANYLPYAFFPLIVGLLLDRLNKGSMLLAGLSMALVSIAMLSIARSVIDLALIRALSGIAHAFFWPSAEAIISMRMSNDYGKYGNDASSSDIITNKDGKSNLGTVKSISRFTMAWVSGYMVGPLIGSSLFHLGYTQLFIYSSTMTIPALICSIILLKHGQGSNSIDSMRRSNGDRGSGRIHPTLTSIIKGRIMLIAMIMYYSASFAILLSIVPSYMKDNGIDEQLIGLLFFIFGIARLLTLFSIKLFARYEHISILVASGAIASAMLIMYITPTSYHFGIALLALGFAFSIYFPITLAMLTRNVPSMMIGSMVGIYETIFGIGWALGPVASGIVADTFSVDAPYIAIFFIGIVMIPLYMVLHLRAGTTIAR